MFVAKTLCEGARCSFNTISMYLNQSCRGDAKFEIFSESFHIFRVHSCGMSEKLIIELNIYRIGLKLSSKIFKMNANEIF